MFETNPGFQNHILRSLYGGIDVVLLEIEDYAERCHLSTANTKVDKSLFERNTEVRTAES
jgi:coenzyme F420-reducing hydrogenase delta subunit